MFKYFLRAKWKNIIMANYAVDPSVLEPYLPPGTELDYFEGKTYVSLVGFLFANTRIFGIPIPGLGTFEEVNLRFYVLRREGHAKKRGVVFIRESVPYKSVARMANWLYKEHYDVLPTYHRWSKDRKEKHISYYWKKEHHWNHLKVHADANAVPIPTGSFEEFIFEHYLGFARLSDQESSMYEVQHPRWMMHRVHYAESYCDFSSMYGDDFAFLNEQPPENVILARGSRVWVKWKRAVIRQHALKPVV
jgi:hypothetical protein